MIFITGGMAQGKSAFAEALAREKGYSITDDYNAIVKGQLKEGLDVEKEAADFALANKNTIVVAQEVGMGVVPIDKVERRYREAAGRAAIKLAEHADEVYRISSGIAQKIK